MKKVLVFLFLAFFPLSPLALFAEKITFSAEEMKGQAGTATSATVLSGNAFIKTDQMEILADKIELSGENYRNIKASGNVSGKSNESKMEFTCNSIEFDRETNVAILQGDVSLIDAENDVSANAQIIEYNQSTEIAVLQIQVKLTQKNNVCSGSYAIYQKKNQLLEISGNASVKQGADMFRAQQITLNMQTQDIKLIGNVKGSVSEAMGKKEEPKQNPTEETSKPEATAPAKSDEVSNGRQ